MADLRRVSIPLGVIFNILLFIPAETLHIVMRCVCKDWYDIIHDPSFVSSHLLRASSGSVLQGFSNSNSVHYLDTSGGEIKLKKEEFLWKTNIVASCNGLWLLEAKINDESLYYVTNPVTKSLLVLPAPRKYHIFHIVGLGYAASIGRYKVVSVLRYTIRVEGSLESFNFTEKYLGVLTLGVDKSWGRICTDPSSYCHNTRIPLLIKGFVYWITTASNTVRSLDVNAELFHSFNAPKALEIRHCLPVAIGDHLALLHGLGKLRYEVWVAREVKRAGEEWTRLPDINLESPCLYANICKDNNDLGLRLVGWLKEEELVLSQSKKVKSTDCIVSNIKTGEVSTLEIGYYIWQSFPYVPSLVSI